MARCVGGERREESRAACPLLTLPAALLAEILVRVPPAARYLTAPRVCRALFELVEEDARVLCAKHGWVLARRPRGVNADTTRSPWRRLYMTRACACCCALGDFCARACSNSHALFLLCGPCARSEAGRARLISRNLKLDLTGVSGKALFTASADRFCAAMHEDGAKRSGRDIMTLDTRGAARASAGNFAGARQRPAKRAR
ncbi:hypothetical protein KFE25_000493 [Diacronema lutheri]|uniref:F-box domain-containing protein n=1 Tax=Diacronema lutheri TaxID=2081491 RepID=A0A8J5XRQ1_DIALT|nr:hypothetical protein KFE25_000493 [Diacronema lutheri]